MSLYLLKRPINSCQCFYLNPPHGTHFNIPETGFDDQLATKENNKIGNRRKNKRKISDKKYIRCHHDAIVKVILKMLCEMYS